MKMELSIYLQFIIYVLYLSCCFKHNRHNHHHEIFASPKEVIKFYGLGVIVLWPAGSFDIHDIADEFDHLVDWKLWSVDQAWILLTFAEIV